MIGNRKLCYYLEIGLEKSLFIFIGLNRMKYFGSEIKFISEMAQKALNRTLIMSQDFSLMVINHYTKFKKHFLKALVRYPQKQVLILQNGEGCNQ